MITNTYKTLTNCDKANDFISWNNLINTKKISVYKIEKYCLEKTDKKINIQSWNMENPLFKYNGKKLTKLEVSLYILDNLQNGEFLKLFNKLFPNYKNNRVLNDLHTLLNTKEAFGLVIYLFLKNHYTHMFSMKFY